MARIPKNVSLPKRARPEMNNFKICSKAIANTMNATIFKNGVTIPASLESAISTLYCFRFEIKSYCNFDGDF